MAKLSILLPARDEEWMHKTIEDILMHIEGDTEILVGLDGWIGDNYIYDHPKIDFVIEKEAIGQRKMTNKLAKKSTAKYLMKVDAHCSFSQGFDVKMIADMQDNYVLIPAMLNLYAYDHVCEDGHRTYQSKIDNCPICAKPVHKEVMWQPKNKPVMTNGCFDTNAVFQWNDPQPQVLKHQTMCIQGAGFMVTRENYWKWNLTDEAFGSWGSHGVEISIKAWQNGGEVWATRNAWMAHLYRDNEEFPYKRDMKQVDSANAMAKKLLTKDIGWLVDKFRTPIHRLTGKGDLETEFDYWKYPADWSEDKIKELK